MTAVTEDTIRKQPVPAAVSGSPTGKCGLLPQHFHRRANAFVVLYLLGLQYFNRRNLLLGSKNRPNNKIMDWPDQTTNVL